jgi:hypothetical protein
MRVGSDRRIVSNTNNERLPHGEHTLYLLTTTPVSGFITFLNRDRRGFRSHRCGFAGFGRDHDLGCRFPLSGDRQGHRQTAGIDARDALRHRDGSTYPDAASASLQPIGDRTHSTVEHETRIGRQAQLADRDGWRQAMDEDQRQQGRVPAPGG